MLATNPMRDVLTKVLRLLQSGMESHDPSYRMLRYWSALEQLYGEPGNAGGNQDRTVRRATFAEEDQLVAQWKLSHIARVRNAYVHAGDNGDEVSTMSQHLRQLLTRHVHFLIHNAKDFSHAEWLRMADLKGTVEDMERLKELIDLRVSLVAPSTCLLGE